MHIGIDGTAWHNKRGYGRHARALFGSLIALDTQNQYTLFVDFAAGWDRLPPQADKHLVYAAAPTAIAAAADGHRSLADMGRMSLALSRAKCDLLIFPTVYSYVPVFTRARKLLFIHDIIAETFPEMTLPSRTARLFWQTKVALGRWQADAIVTVSDYSRQGMVQQFGLSPHLVHVVGEAADPIFRRLEQPTLLPELLAAGVPENGRFLVYLGGFGPHKNLVALVNACADLCRQPEFADLRLVMVGQFQKETFFSYIDTIRQQIADLGLTDRVIFPGFVPDEALVGLLNRATLLALPSLMEGFGLPAIEAAACGCPVVATTASPLPTLLGEGGLYVDPHDQVGLTTSLAQLLRSSTLRQQMSQAGLAAAATLTWEAAARQLLRVIYTLA